MELNTYMAEKKTLIENTLNKILLETSKTPTQIHEAMRYSVFAGGKRLRPALCLAACEAVKGDSEEVLLVACAWELIHTYSLVHDDLPAMDNDDLRRGKPTNHIVFGEAMAILAGDALLTYAFQIINQLGLSTANKEKMFQVGFEMAKASGTQGMIGGQVVDILSENQKINEEDLLYIHNHKTGAIITGSIKTGAILGGGTGEQIEALTRYGDNLGLAFQITDDLLDIFGDVDKIGKPVGSDDKNQKATFPGVFGLSEAQKMAEKAVQEAEKALNLFGPEAEPLRMLARYLLERQN